ncbi:MAG: HD domain-containing protein [Candidatus Andersenbacteria bacterium]|nr:HD domain-containing protein [Candidatus Andersenbacteria bacterium]
MQLPNEVKNLLETLQTAGFEAFVVGGSVRDLLLGHEPKDWDVTTNAKPEEIQKLFPRNFYANDFGTVTVLTGAEKTGITEVEVTTYRVDAGYSDNRHPDSVQFTGNLKEDLARRDFTVNALALRSGSGSFPVRQLAEGRVGEVAAKFNPLYPPYQGEDRNKPGGDSVLIDNMSVVDPFGGLKDLHAKVIRSVGAASERFQEDALRLMRAIRLAAQLGFEIEAETLSAIKAHANLIEHVSKERMRDELVKIVMSEKPEFGFNLLRETGLLSYIIPELMEGVGIEQNKHHVYTVFEHNVKSLQFAADFGYPVEIRLAALLHDVGKPRTRRFASVQGGAPNEGDYTFYAHDIVGAKMTEKLLKRLKFSGEMVEKITHLVRQHMFYYDVGKLTEAGVRRLLRRVGPDHFADLIKLRMAERKGSGVPKAEPYRLRHLQFMVEKVAKQAISVGQLKINGNDLMKELGVKPGPVIGGVLNALLAEVIEEPEKNEREYLLKRAQELKDKDPKELKALGMKAIEEEEKKQEDDIRRKYHV